MNIANKRLCLISSISFIAGVMMGPFTMMAFSELISPNRYRQEQEAKAFFYKTMNALFEGTYDANEGSVSPEFMNAFKKYEPQFGKKCNLYIIDSTPGYYECIAFFPSGDVFSLAIEWRNDSWILYGFHQRDWDSFWRYTIEDAQRLCREAKGNS